MFKRHIVSLGLILTAVSVGLVQIHSPVARSLSVHAEHRNTTSCHSLCSAPAERRQNPAVVIEDDEPSPKPPYFNTISIETIGVGLLQENNIWRQSSWVPPDLTLLSGRYTTAL